MGSNSYSRRWFEFFHVGIDEERTVRETAFVCRCAPLPDFQRLADICCGMGRHARALSRYGYSVVGIDREAEIVVKARDLAGGPDYVVADIRDYRPKPGSFDAGIVMGQSFGHFDATTNRGVLDRLAASLRAGGRVVLDLWNPDFFAAHQGERKLAMPGGAVHESKRMDGDRLFVRLDYPDTSQEEFEWQLFTPSQMNQLAESVGMAVILSCTDFDAAVNPSPNQPRIQFVLERGS
ncbi:MAG: class I SAM-dependent methyltransferase [Verrucomicrobiota bacterium]